MYERPNQAVGSMVLVYCLGGSSAWAIDTGHALSNGLGWLYPKDGGVWQGGDHPCWFEICDVFYKKDLVESPEGSHLGVGCIGH